MIKALSFIFIVFGANITGYNIGKHGKRDEPWMYGVGILLQIIGILLLSLPSLG